MEEPIVALATPYAPSALAVLRTSGEGSIELIASLFSNPKRLREAESHTLVHGTLHGKSGETLDEVVAGVYRAPGGYTGEDSVELFCHGSLAGIRRALDALLELGFRQAAPGEFTRRAFMNGKLDLTRAEAIQEVVAAKTRTAHSIAMDRMHGLLFRNIDIAKRELLRQRAAVEVQLDYPEDEVQASVSPAELRRIRDNLAELASSYDRGRLYQDGARIAIAGPTNAGKSSLFNLILRHDRAIVSSAPGTTRDYLEAEVSFAGVPIRLYDTAGYRDVVELVETEGIERSGEVSRAADVVLYVVDATEGLDVSDRRRLRDLREHVPCVVVWNKVDLEHARQPEDGAVAVSAATGTGLADLEARVPAILMGDDREPVLTSGTDGHRTAMIDSLRQKRLLERAVESLDAVLEALDAGVHLDLLAVDLKDAVDALGEITGEVTSADVLEQIFSGFCVGK
jgi:tRNA modification GTPase